MWVNISQAAKLTGYKYGEIRRLIAKGAFPFYHNGRKSFKFELEDLKTAMKAEMEATQAAAKKKWEEQQLGARPFDFKGGMARLKAEAKVEKSRLKRCHLKPNRRTEHRGKFGFTIGDE